MLLSSLVISEHSYDDISTISGSISSTSFSSSSSTNNPIGRPKGSTNAVKQHRNDYEKAAVNQIATLY